MAQTAIADEPARDFNPDGTFRGSKFATDALQTLDNPITDILSEVRGTVQVELETVSTETIFVADCITSLPAGVNVLRFTWDGVEQNLYLNGVLVDSVTAESAPSFDDIVTLERIGTTTWYKVFAPSLTVLGV